MNTNRTPKLKQNTQQQLETTTTTTGHLACHLESSRRPPSPRTQEARARGAEAPLPHLRTVVEIRNHLLVTSPCCCCCCCVPAVPASDSTTECHRISRATCDLWPRGSNCTSRDTHLESGKRPQCRSEFSIQNSDKPCYVPDPLVWTLSDPRSMAATGYFLLLNAESRTDKSSLANRASRSFSGRASKIARRTCRSRGGQPG